MSSGNLPSQDRRHGESAVPLFLEAYLTEEQINALRQAEKFGWHLAFVRRPVFQDTVTVMENADHPGQYALLRTDGEMNLSPELTMRA